LFHGDSFLNKKHVFKEKHTMSATVTVSLGSVREQDSAKNRPTHAGDASQSDISEASMKEGIAKLAYALWQQRGCPYGTPEFDWFEAEHTLSQSSEQVPR
jgi:hypothetical protein